MKRIFFIAIFHAALTLEIKSDQLDEIPELNVSILGKLTKPGGDNNKLLVNAAENLNEWYPHGLICMFEPKIESFQNIDAVVLDLHYKALQGELCWLHRVRFQGNMKDGFAEELVARRASSLVGSYPVSFNRNPSEDLRFADLVVSYWNINGKAVIDALKFNLQRWSNEDALIPVLILSAYEVEDFKSRLADYKHEDYSKLEEMIHAIIKSKKMALDSRD